DTDNPVLGQVTTSGINVQPLPGAPGWTETEWVDDKTGHIATSATDGGLGVASFSFPGNDSTNVTQSKPENCTGTTNSQCPQNISEPARPFHTHAYHDGLTQTAVAAYDALGQVDWRGWWIRVDHSPPSIATSGNLSQANAGQAPYGLHVQASDGNDQSSDGSG